MHQVRKEQQKKLICSLQNYPKLFQGGLGVLNIPPVHPELWPLNKDK